MSFRIGELVVCIDAEENPDLEKGRVYTVAGTFWLGELTAIAVEEIPGEDVFWSLYLAHRFRPIGKRQHERVRALLQPIPTREGAPA